MKAVYENHYLTDQDVANFARQSFGKLADEFSEAQNNDLVRFLARGMASKEWEKLIDEMLTKGKIDYGATVGSPMEINNRKSTKDLARYLRSIPEHWVPFGHPHITLRMQAPVPITVQCYKHKIGFVESGESRRYVKSTPEVHIPLYFREAAVNVKQGSGGVHPQSDGWLKEYKESVRKAVQLYEDMIAGGVCPEQARFVLPQGTELNWVWTGSLYAFANMVNLRKDPHSQKEVQWLADEIDHIIEPLFPVSWPALTQGVY